MQTHGRPPDRHTSGCHACSCAPVGGVDVARSWVCVRRGDLQLQWGLEARPWDARLRLNPSSATETDGLHVWTPAFPVAPCPHLQSEATAECALWEAVMTYRGADTHHRLGHTWHACRHRHMGHRPGTRRQSRTWAGGKTHRLVGLKQNMELYGTMGRGPLLITSSASTSFFPSAWLSRSTLPPTSTKATKLGVQLIDSHHAGNPWAISAKLQPHRLVDPPGKGTRPRTQLHTRPRLITARLPLKRVMPG